MLNENFEKFLYCILIALAIFLIGIQLGIHKGILIQKERTLYDYQIAD